MALGSREEGHLLGSQLAVDSFKLVPANPASSTRNSFLRALDNCQKSGRLDDEQYRASRNAVWVAFVRFAMGPKTTSNGAVLTGIRGDKAMPEEFVGEPTPRPRGRRRQWRWR
jgi:hypothetical protein